MNGKSEHLWDKIKCPNCGALIPVSEALIHQIEERVRAEAKGQILAKQREFEEKEKEFARKEAELSKKMEKELEERIKREEKKIEEKCRKEAEKKVLLEFEDMKNQLKEKEQKLAEMQKLELELRKKERELEEKVKTAELEIARRLDDERKNIEEKITKRVIEEQRLKEAEKDKLINDLKWQLEEAKRKAEQRSQQLQGEILELDLEALLKGSFYSDDIQSIPKGTRGADILQKVYDKRGRFCGAIIWEIKRAKNWSENWVDKLKDDQKSAKAEIAVLVSEVLPKEISNFGERNGVWITNPALASEVALILREMLIQVSHIRVASESKEEKVEILFKYLSGVEFKQRLEAILETYLQMKEELEREKRTTTARWAKQEKNIERTITAIAGMYGDLRGLIGNSMQPIPQLEAEVD
jgi:hypothetical protein